MGRRLQFQTVLETLRGIDPELKLRVYFQPPGKQLMEYPCIRYEPDYAKTLFAGNRPHLFFKRYLVTVMDKDPDSDIPDLVAQLPMSTFNRFFVADQVNHTAFHVYF